MPSEVAIIEKEMNLLAPRFDVMLRAAGVNLGKFMQGLLICVERNPALADPDKCSRQSLMNTAMSSAFLALEMDGYTGQAFPVPFAGRAQLIIGYKGFNTMYGRGGFTINGASIYENDEFDVDLGIQQVHHKPTMGPSGRLIGTWAQAVSQQHPPTTPVVLRLDDIMAIKAKSPGAKKKDSPWNDPTVGFAAMAEKSAKRRLARSIPLLNDPIGRAHLGAALDEAFEERGRHAYIHPTNGLQVDGDGPLPMRTADQPVLDMKPTTFMVLRSEGDPLPFDNPDAWASMVEFAMGRIKTVDQLAGFMERNKPEFDKVAEAAPDVHARAMSSSVARRTELLNQ